VRSLNKVLVVCTKYDLSGEAPWLTNEFCEELAGRGIEVVVCFVDWSASVKEYSLIKDGAVTVIACPKKNYERFVGWGKLMKWAGASFGAYREVKARVGLDFDVVVSFSPSFTDMGLVNRVVRRRGAKSFYILWDFFPMHHRQIGLIKNSILYLGARLVERYMMSFHDVVALMSPANIKYFESVWPEFSSVKKIIFPIWGRSSSSRVKEIYLDERERLGFAQDDYVCVYGGQLDAGRGVDVVFELADIVPENVKFLIIGWGENFDFYREKSNAFRNISVVPARPRAEYKALLGSCDCGLVLTDTATDVPTFPSKTFDYFDAGLPIIAHTEVSTDYGYIISSIAKAGYSSSGAGVASLSENIALISQDKTRSKKMGQNGRDYLLSELQVSSAVDRFIESVIAN